MKNFLVILSAFAMLGLTANAQEQFRTQTIGGWGSNPKGNNPGTYLHENFDQLTIRTDAVTIGAGDLTLTFTSAEAITAFLPASGSPAALTETFIDPTKKDIRNTFASQILALTISTSFDAVIEDYSASTLSLGTMVVAEGAMAGLSVTQVLAEANQLLAGLESQYTISQANATISKINEAYVDGEIVNGAYLIEGTASASQELQLLEGQTSQQSSSSQLQVIETLVRP